MALDGKALGDAIASALAGVPKPDPADGGIEHMKKYWEAVGNAVVTYLKANAEILPGSLAITPSSLSSMPGTSGGPISGNGAVTSGTGKIS